MGPPIGTLVPGGRIGCRLRLAVGGFGRTSANRRRLGGPQAAGFSGMNAAPPNAGGAISEGAKTLRSDHARQRRRTRRKTLYPISITGSTTGDAASRPAHANLGSCCQISAKAAAPDARLPSARRTCIRASAASRDRSGPRPFASQAVTSTKSSRSAPCTLRYWAISREQMGHAPS
jgi:hypothetical protein